MPKFNWKGNISAEAVKLAEHLKAEADRASEELLPKLTAEVNKEFSDWQRYEVQQMFKESVDEFYHAYVPSVYPRQGNEGSGGLYELLSSNVTGNDGLLVFNAPNYDELYDPSKMHPGRGGYDGLYQKVFVEGWHGGAEGIASEKVAKYGAHPSPGTPYYRKPVPYYKRWGRPAVQTKSAYDIMKEKMNEADKEGGWFDEMFLLTARRVFDDSPSMQGKTYRDYLQDVVKNAASEYMA